MKARSIISGLFRKLIFIRIRVLGNEISQKELAIVHFNKGKALIKEWKSFEIDSLPKLKNNLAVLLITGDQVVTKPYDKEDQTIKRITKNKELIWSIDYTDEEKQTLSFLRREDINTLLESINRNKLFLIDTWVNDINNEFAINDRIEKSYNKLFQPNGMNQSVDLKNILANILFQKILLPTLSIFLIFLLGNYYIYSHYMTEYQIKQSKIHKESKTNKDQSLHHQKINQLTTTYNQIPNKSFALLSDRIASYIPSNLYLSSMIISPLIKNGTIKSKNEIQINYQIINLKGYVETPGSVTLLTQLLEGDILFSKVKVISLYRAKEENHFEFELEITL